jgi:hypothetical protein
LSGQNRKRFDKKIEILEKSKHSEIDKYANPQNMQLLFFVWLFENGPSKEKINRRADKYKYQKANIPPAVEAVTGGKKHDVLPPEILPEKPPV